MRDEAFEIEFSVVIPVYNSVEALQPLCARLGKVFCEALDAAYEIILVDDGSPNPDTWREMMRLAEADPRIRIFQLMRNFGKPAAMMCGFNQVRGQYVITMDDDLQHFPEDIPKLAAERAHDIVIGRFAENQHSSFNRLTSSIKGWFDHKLIGKPRRIQNTPFKLINARIIHAITQINTPYPFIPALLFFTTRDVVMVTVNHGKRVYGKSGYGFGKRVRTFSNLLINNSSFLLQAVAIVGILMAFSSFLLAFYFIAKKLIVHAVVPGWTSMISINLFTSGMILFSLGIIGEYLLRIVSGIENRPPFVVRRSYEKKESD